MECKHGSKKVAVVTGAGSGIGAAIARCYAENGMHVVCADLSAEKGKKLVDVIHAEGKDAVFYQADCSSEEDIKTLIAFAVEYYGKLDGIVNSAGIGMGGTPLHELSLADYEKITNLNLKGTFLGMKYGAEAILKSKSASGFMINIASVAGLVPQRGQTLYTATKFGVVGMTQAAALDYAAHNLTVNAICPGYTLTSMFDGIPKHALNFFEQDCPAGRLGEPAECAALALFLASDMSRYITGAAIPIDGALSAGAKNVVTWKHPEILAI